MSDETRVGYMTVDILTKMLEKYIRAHTDTETYGFPVYTGKPHYLEQYRVMVDYLERKG